MKHIHVGAGGLGLGLIVPMIASSGIGSILINRRSSSSEARNLRLQSDSGFYLKNGNQVNWVAFEKFYFDDEIHSGLFEKDVYLLTISVKDGISDSVFLEFLTKLILDISASCKFLYVCACENAIFSSDLKTTLIQQNEPLNQNYFGHSKIEFLEAVADRVCQEPKLENKVTVEVSGTGSLSIGDFKYKDNLSKSKIIFLPSQRMFDSKIEKIILFNLSHALICIWAIKSGYSYLDKYLEDSSSGKFVLNNIISELITIILYKYPAFDESSLVIYAANVQKRFVETRNDPILRILKRFNGENDLQISSFYKNIWSKGLNLLSELNGDQFVAFPYVSKSLFNIASLIANDQYISE